MEEDKVREIERWRVIELGRVGIGMGRYRDRDREIRGRGIIG